MGRRLRADPVARIGTVVLLALVLAAALAGWIAPDPLAGSLDERLAAPSWHHPFGTDHQGRDVLSRTLYGARLSLGIGLTARLVSVLVGGILGLFAGFRGGLADSVIMRTADVFFAFPSLLLLIGITAAFEPGITLLLVALGIVGWAEVARLVRSEAMRVRESEYVQAALALGVPWPRILWRHVAPNCLNPLLVSFTMGVATTILAESSLSFLGLGAQPPAASWGAMVSAGKDYLTSAPWVSVFPGLMLALSVLSLNLLGDAVRDALDPRTVIGNPGERGEDA
ncbi:MAG: ABC transporter permease [Gemmatimonadetes bacterium]|nr:ABC transporter permease [Gemmatimonadota bacterium]